MTCNYLSMPALLALSFLLPAAAQAEDSGSSKPIETIVVTAQKYLTEAASVGTKSDTPILITPMSVQVVPQQVLQDQQTLHLSDALQNVSGVIPNNDSFGTADSFTIRGFDQMEMTYEDGIRLDQYTVSGFPRDMATVESIEVVKGPASVLYGQAEPGGLVAIDTKKPLAAPAYSVEQQIGSYDLYRTVADATGPLNDDGTLLYRFIADYENLGSFRDFVHSDHVGIYPSLSWQATPNDQLLVQLGYQTGTVYLDYGVPFLETGRPANVPDSANFSGPGVNSGPASEYSWKIAATHDFSDDWKLRLVYAGLFVNNPQRDGHYYLGDADAAGNLAILGLTENVFKHWAQQVVLDLTGHFETFGIAHTLVAGFDYYHHNGTYHANLFFPPPVNIYAPDFSVPDVLPDPSTDFAVVQLDNAYGFYVQDQVDLPGDLHVLAGFRYDDVTTANSGYGPGASSIHSAPGPTPRFGILWQPLPEISLYTSYTENFGASALGATTFNGIALPPESARQYEVGAKAQLLDNKLSVTASLYDLTKQNVPGADPAHPTFSIAIGEARSRGFELDVVGELLPGWQVIGGYSYIDSTVTKDDNTPSLAGLPFPGVAKHSGSLWSIYEFQAGDLKGLHVGAGVVAVGPRAAFESPTGVSYMADRIPGYAIVNAMVGDNFVVGGVVWRAQLNINNLFDRHYYSAVGPSQAFPGEPLNAVGELSVRF